MVYCIQEALYEWSETTGGCVEWVLKGQHILTEMFSALEAEIPVSSCTLFNDKLHTSLMASDRLLVCGQAMSHCVNYTLRDIVARWPKGELDRICLLTDCASAVPGFEAAALQFLEEMEEAGVRLARAVDLDSILL
jgi:nicotinamidase/pyrazinamidase